MDIKDVPSSLYRQSSNDVAFYKTNKNDYVNISLMAVCPFDASHVMKTSRLQNHIVKCIKHYKGTKVPCPYNHCEYYEPEEMTAHLANCPSRADLQVHRYMSDLNRKKAEKTNAGYAFEAPILPGETYTNEDWDED